MATTRRRWELRDAEGVIGGELDQQYDAIYMSILSLCGDVTAEMDVAISRDRRLSAGISIAINFGVLLLLASIAGVVMWKQRGEPRFSLLIREGKPLGIRSRKQTRG